MGNGQLIRLLLKDFAILAPVIGLFFLAYLLWRQRTLRFFRRCESLFRRLARHRLRAGLVIGLFSFCLSLIISLLSHLPVPAVNDEFSYLLAADTFAHGRLTNPTHPMWQHFESFHIIHQPTYASKYPPGQGMVMALGQVLTGYPIVGVWLSVAVACAAIFWMLNAYVPPGWSLFGAVVSVIHPLTILWSQNYWGGAVAVIGGALVLGAVGRIVKEPKSRDGFLLGLGLAVLANSRPYEGLLFSVALIFVLLVWLVRQKRISTAILLNRVAAPLVAVLCITFVGMARYNCVVTGNMFRMPYQVHHNTYEISPIFIFQPLNPEPLYNHTDLSNGYETFVKLWYEEPHSSIRTMLTACKAKFISYPIVFLKGLILGLPLLAAPFVLKKDKWIPALFFVLFIISIGLSIEVFTHFHYAAPMFGLILVLSLRLARRLRLLRWRQYPLGKVVVSAWAVYCVVSLCFLGISKGQEKTSLIFEHRAQLIKTLSQDEQKHLIIVRYGSSHFAFDELVYNEADIDNAKIVWARDMGPEENHRLCDYFHDRRLWLLTVDADISSLVPYDDSQQSKAP